MDNSYVQQYSKVGIQTGIASANPHRLILMLIEGAIASISFSKKEMQTGNIATKGAAISKAICIIGELDASLNMEAGGEIALNLRRLYEYMSITLMHANFHNIPEKLHEVIQLLSELKKGWEGISNEAEAALHAETAKPREEVMSYGNL